MNRRARRREAKRKRHGRDEPSRMRIDQISGPSPVDLDKYWEELGAFLDAVPDKIGELKGQLIQAMAPYDAFDVITNLLFANLPLDPETYRETAHLGLVVYAEYAALALLER